VTTFIGTKCDLTNDVGVISFMFYKEN